MKILYFKIFDSAAAPGLQTWYASAPDVKNDPQKTLSLIQREAHKKGIHVTYTLASPEDYRKYRDSISVKKNPASGDAVTAHELALFIINDGQLYRGQTASIILNLQRKIKRGIYKPALALKLWGYLADSGAKKYTFEHGDAHGARSWQVAKGYGIFTVPIRDRVAQSLADHYAEQVGATGGPGNKTIRLVQNPREFPNYYISLPREYAHARFGVDAVTPVPWTVHSKPKLPGYVRYYKLPRDLLKSPKFRAWIAGREQFSPDGNLIQLKALLRGML